MLHLVATVAALLLPLRPTMTPPRAAPPRCAAMPGAEFEEALAGRLSTAASDSMEAALDAWLPRVDDTFIPLLAGRVDAAEAFKDDPANANPQLPQLLELNAARQQRVQARFERARDQLETLRILTHVHTRLQEELEKKTEPALALLHKLTRTSAAPIRGNILRHNLVPGGAAVDGVIKLPDGTALPGDAAKAKALVPPTAVADAVSDTLEKVRRMGAERRVLEETAEEIRQVAKEARAVIEEAYDGETLDAFSEALAPAFKNSLSPDFYKPPAPKAGD